jgi:hypothetical protein
LYNLFGLLRGRSANGASVCTSTALDAGISVDHELAVALRDGLYGALTGAGAASDAFVRNLISHGMSSL